MSISRLRQTTVILALLVYAVLEQYSNTSGAPPGLGAVLATLPLLLALALLAMRSPRPAMALSVLLLAAIVLLPLLWPDLERQYARLYLLQECGVYFTLAVVFGRSLLPGETPLCTQWAERVHGSLDAQVRGYTRTITLVWTVFFTAVVIGSAVLFATVARAAWSLFGNFLVLPLAALLFAVEYQLRRRRLPTMPRATFAQMASAYFAAPRGTRRS